MKHLIREELVCQNPLPLTPDEERIYMRFPEMRRLRKLAFSRESSLCANCREAKAAELHHIRYENLGKDTLEDIAAVCRGCHPHLHAVPIGDPDILERFLFYRGACQNLMKLPPDYVGVPKHSFRDALDGEDRKLKYCIGMYMLYKELNSEEIRFCNARRRYELQFLPNIAALLRRIWRADGHWRDRDRKEAKKAVDSPTKIPQRSASIFGNACEQDEMFQSDTGRMSGAFRSCAAQ